MYEYGFLNTMFTIVPVFVVLVFILIFGIIIARLARGAAQWKRNNASPVLTVDAAVVTKRADVRHHSHMAGGEATMPHMSSSTTYYATFEVPSGDRMELRILDSEYGQLVEGDSGRLTFQGTRYLGFERKIVHK